LHYDIDIDLSFGLGDTATNRLRDVYPPPHVNVGPFDIASYPGCEATDLKGASQFAGVPVIGVLGAITLGGGTLQIDFSKSVLRIFPSDGREHPEWGERRPMEGWDSALFNINGHNLSLIVDTGNNYFMAANPSLFSVLHQTKDVQESSDHGFTVTSGLSSWPCLVLKHLTIDGRPYSNSVSAAVPFTTSTLGTGFLRNFMVTLDCQRGYLYLKPANPPATSTTAISSVQTTRKLHGSGFR
jgi:hypothetical protein